MNKTLLIITPGRAQRTDCVFSLLVAETGEHLADHFCSNSGFAYNDLYGQRPERKEKWGQRFGEIEVKFIDEVDISIEELVRRNSEWAKKEGILK